MRHLKKGRKFGRVRKTRTAFMRELAVSFFRLGRIETTETRAKELRPYVEKFITRAKEASLADRRLLRRTFSDAITKRIITEAEAQISRKGGYTRIIKTGPRASDATHMAILELVR